MSIFAKFKTKEELIKAVSAIVSEEKGEFFIKETELTELKKLNPTDLQEKINKFVTEKAALLAESKTLREKLAPLETEIGNRSTVNNTHQTYRSYQCTVSLLLSPFRVFRAFRRQSSNFRETC